MRATEDTYAVAHAIETLAHICLELGQPEEALALLVEGEPMIMGFGTPGEIAHYRLERARALAALGQHERAAAIAMQLARAAGRFRPSRSRAGARTCSSPTSSGTLDDLPRAQELYELAVDCLEGPAVASKHLVAAYRGLAELLKNKGKRDEARSELLERALSSQAPAAFAPRT